jgi:hypothetical protein
VGRTKHVTRTVRICIACVLFLLPAAATAQDSVEPEVRNDLARYISLPAKVRLHGGVEIGLGQRRESGRFDAVFEGVRSDSLLLAAIRGGGTGSAALVDVRSLEVEIRRTHEEGVAHGALNGLMAGAAFGLSYKLLDNRLATDTGGQRLHGTFDGIFGEAVVGAVMFGLPGAVIGLVFPGRRWEKIWPK